MKKRIALVLAGLFLVFVTLIIYRHPIILKWMRGTARIIGFTKRATVYADDVIDQRIKVFHCDKYWDGRKADYYILYLLSPYSFRTKHIVSLDIPGKFAGVPSATDKNAIDLVFGILFQSENGDQFSDFKDEMKGYGFDPHLDISGNTIRFNLPSKLKPGISMIRIEFSE